MIQGIVLTALYVVIGMIMLKCYEMTGAEMSEDMKLWVMIFWPVALVSILSCTICMLIVYIFHRPHQDE